MESEILERVKKLSALDFINTTAIVRITGLANKKTALYNILSNLKQDGKRRGRLNSEEAGKILIAFEQAYKIFGEQLGHGHDDFPWNCKCSKCGARFMKSAAERTDGSLVCINSPDCNGEGDEIQTYK